jgi:hypothetical protein
MTDKLREDIVRAAREAVAHDPEANISSEGVRTIIETALLALRSATPMPGVKALEWREFATSRHDYGHGVWDANGPWTTYSIWDCFEGGFDDEDRYYARAISKSFHTVEAAKAAVQADFEARILSALTTPPAREVSDDMARALVAKYRKMWPGDGWPSLGDAKDLIAAALEAARSPS